MSRSFLMRANTVARASGVVQVDDVLVSGVNQIAVPARDDREGQADLSLRQGLSVGGARARVEIGQLVDLIDHLQRRLNGAQLFGACLLYTSPSPRDRTRSRM